MPAAALRLPALRLAAAVCALGALCAASPAARADDEGSLHTMAVHGDPADTIAVSFRFADDAGWSMDIRTAAGAPERRVALPFLGTEHGHYLVAVAPGRTGLVFVLASRERGATTRESPMVWFVEPDGRVVKTLAVSQLHRGRTLALRTSVSHDLLLGDGVAAVERGRLTLPLGPGRRATIDLARRALVR